MIPVVKPDGTVVHPTTGRRTKYPWQHMEVGDHFVAPVCRRASIIQATRAYGLAFEVHPGVTPDTIQVLRRS